MAWARQVGSGKDNVCIIVRSSDVEPTGFTGKWHVEQGQNKEINDNVKVFSMKNCENKIAYIYEEESHFPKPRMT